MKYSVHSNQFAAMRLGLNRLNIDLIDLAIFDVLVSFSGNLECERITDSGGIQYFWMSYGKMREELPLYDAKKRSYFDRLKKLEKARIIKFHPENQAIGKTFFTWDINYGAMTSSHEIAYDFETGMQMQDTPPMQKNADPYVKNYTPPMQKNADPYVKNYTPPMQKNADYNSTIDNTTNHNTIDNKTSAENFGAFQDTEFHNSVKAEKKEKEKISPRAREKRIGPPYTIDDVKQHLDSGQAEFLDAAYHVLSDYEQYRKGLDRFAYKDAKSYALFVKSLYKKADGDVFKAQRIVDQSRENGWKGIFELKKNQDANKNAKNGFGPGIGNRTTTFADFSDSGNPFFSGVK